MRHSRRPLSRTSLQAVLLTAGICLLACCCQATIWNVGPTRTYTTPSQVTSLVQDGDTVYLDGGVYANDAVKWTRKNLKIIGLGTGANRATLQYTGNIPNGKGIFVFETVGAVDNPYIENIVFDGAQVSDAAGGNGAGIRFQAHDITVNRCKFIHCQNGILEGGASATSNTTILNSEFEDNGYQLPNDPTYSGYEHHIYISAGTDTLLVSNCYFHHPRGQANSIKTRAQRSFILYNYIDEAATGYGSWELNLAQGGLNVVMGNVIVQGPAGANHGIIGYDAATNALEDFYFVNNTVINQYPGNIQYFNIVPASGIQTFKMYNNVFAGVSGATPVVFGSHLPGGLDTAHNVFAPAYAGLGFTDPAGGDYSLTAAATALIDKGTAAGSTATAYGLTPFFMYQSHASALTPRTVVNGTIDIGAYERSGSTTAGMDAGAMPLLRLWPNPCSGKFRVSGAPWQGGRTGVVAVYDALGNRLLGVTVTGSPAGADVDLGPCGKGLYLVRVWDGGRTATAAVIVQ